VKGGDKMKLKICILWISIVSLGYVRQGPLVTLQLANKRIQRVLDKKSSQERVLVLVNSLLDFEGLAKGSLGKHWYNIKENQRKEFSDLLRRLIEKNYLRQIKKSLKHRISYNSEKIKGDKASVQTTVYVSSGKRESSISIEYKMRLHKGKWIVFDIITDEVSLLRNYRSQFNRIIKKESFEGLLNRMRRKLNS
jgi:phospholipid transport system substrate-binding protein